LHSIAYTYGVRSAAEGLHAVHQLLESGFCLDGSLQLTIPDAGPVGASLRADYESPAVQCGADAAVRGAIGAGLGVDQAADAVAALRGLARAAILGACVTRFAVRAEPVSTAIIGQERVELSHALFIPGHAAAGGELGADVVHGRGVDAAVGVLGYAAIRGAVTAVLGTRGAAFERHGAFRIAARVEDALVVLGAVAAVAALSANARAAV